MILKLKPDSKFTITVEKDFTIVEGLPDSNIKPILKDLLGEITSPDDLKKKVDDLSGQAAREIILKIADKIMGEP